MARDGGAETLSMVVGGTARVADDIFSFELRHKDGTDLPEFTAGAHISVRAPNGCERKYSLCNNPAERDRYVIAVKREADGRGGSRSLVDGSKPGDELQIAAPRNNFALVKSPAGYLFIAGGIGITPIMSMVWHLKHSGAGRFRLYYCARTPGLTAFADTLG